MSAHRLTLVPWRELMLRSLKHGPVTPIDEMRWTAACDCGWWSTTSEPQPAEVLMGYSEHLDDSLREMLTNIDDEGVEALARVYVHGARLSSAVPNARACDGIRAVIAFLTEIES